MGIAERIYPSSVDFCVWCKPPRRDVAFRPLLVKNSLHVVLSIQKSVPILFLDIDDRVQLRNDQEGENRPASDILLSPLLSCYYTRKTDSLFVSKTGWA